MLETVHLTRNGIQAPQWDNGAGQYVNRKIATAIHVLRCFCHIDDGVTLGEIFRTVEQDPELAQFLQKWSWCDIEAFHAEARKPPVEKASDLTHIEMAKSFDWRPREAQEIIDVYAIGEPNERGRTHYALDLMPVNELVHLPVRLRPQMEIRKDRKKLGEAPCTFTLLEVLGEIYAEISFYGSPEDRDREFAELMESYREIDEGRAILFPLRPPNIRAD